MASGGYVSHGSRGYHVVGYQSAGLVHVSAIPRSGQASRISLALGPRMGSAASAARMEPARVTHPGIARMARIDRMHPHPGHPPRNPKRPRPHMHPHTRPQHTYDYLDSGNQIRVPMFCDFRRGADDVSDGQRRPFGCLGPVKARGAFRRL